MTTQTESDEIKFVPATECDVSEGDEVTIRYESSRGGMKTKSGVVTSTEGLEAFTLDTGEEFDDGTPKVYDVYNKLVSGLARDGSNYSLTPKIATQQVEVRVDESEDDESESEDNDVDPMAAFEEPDDIEEGMELTDGSGDVYLLYEIDGGDTKVQIWNDGRLKRTELMPTASLRTEYKNGELEIW